MQHLVVTKCKNAQDAIDKGFNQAGKYKGYRPLVLKAATIVQDGTVGHNPTVDLVLEDADGNRYVTMTTGTILNGLNELVKVGYETEDATD